MYIPDLTQYIHIRPEPNTLTVGWISIHHPYSTGDVPQELLTRLSAYEEYIVNAFSMGPGRCELCRNFRSWGEIRVLSTDGTAYAAPSMIDHYIEIHNYQPPRAFINAVLSGPPPDSKAYYELARSFP